MRIYRYVVKLHCIFKCFFFALSTFSKKFADLADLPRHTKHVNKNKFTTLELRQSRGATIS